MLSKRKKDQKLRKFFYKSEKKIKINKILLINLLSTKKFSSSLKKNLDEEIQKNILISKVKLNNICNLTNRSKAVYKRYSLSRIKIREMMQFGIIPGYKKAIW